MQNRSNFLPNVSFFQNLTSLLTVAQLAFFLSMIANVAAKPAVKTTPAQWCQVRKDVKENVTGSFYIVLPTDTTARRINGQELSNDTNECKTFFKANGKLNERSECPW
jgi:hypothetical protein